MNANCARYFPPVMPSDPVGTAMNLAGDPNNPVRFKDDATADELRAEINAGLGGCRRLASLSYSLASTRGAVEPNDSCAK